jgi:hypothetical protein
MANNKARRLEAPGAIEKIEEEIERMLKRQKELQAELLKLSGSDLEAEPSEASSLPPSDYEMALKKGDWQNARQALERFKKRQSFFGKLFGSKKEKELSRKVEELYKAYQSGEVARGGAELESMKSRSDKNQLSRLQDELMRVESQLEYLYKEKEKQESYL